jgi:hypothetical protein
VRRSPGMDAPTWIGSASVLRSEDANARILRLHPVVDTPGSPFLARDPVRILFAPLVHGLQDGLETLAEGRQGVFHLRRHLPVDLASKDAVGLQFPELLGERSAFDASRRTGRDAVR